MSWISVEDYEFPNNKQQFENYKNTLDNVFIGLVPRDNGKGETVFVVEPIKLYAKPLGGEYWEDVYGDESKPVKWMMMPEPPK